MILLDAHGHSLNAGPAVAGPAILNPEGEAVTGLPVVGLLVPTRDTVTWGFAHDYGAMMAFTAMHMPEVKLKQRFDLQTLLVSQREDLAHWALDNGCTHLLWIDSDMRFPMWSLLHMLATMHEKGYEVLAANYPTRGMPVRTVAFKDFKVSDERVYTTPESPEFEKVSGVGMGLMLVKADVMTRLPQPWFQIGYSPAMRSFEGEDLHFARRLEAAGVDIWIDHNLSEHVRHQGAFEYKHQNARDQRKILEAGAATAEKAPA
jgi:hypothetical protein